MGVLGGLETMCVFGGGGRTRIEEDVSFPVHSKQKLIGFLN